MNTQNENGNDQPSFVLVPWDFSEYSKAALVYACKRFARSAICVLCVLEKPNPYAMGFQWNENAEKHAAQECAKEFVAGAGVRKAEELQFVSLFGEPADEIVRFANTQQAEFILMATRGRTGLQKLFLGSVAQKVIAHASCPIILLPNQWLGFEVKQ